MSCSLPRVGNLEHSNLWIDVGLYQKRWRCSWPVRNLAHRTRIDATWRNRKKLEKEVAFLYIFLIYGIFCDVLNMAGGENVCDIVNHHLLQCRAFCGLGSLYTFGGSHHYLPNLTRSNSLFLWGRGGSAVLKSYLCVVTFSVSNSRPVCPLYSSYWWKPKIQLRPEVWFPLDQGHIDFPTCLY